jgi:hypothetical protein
MPEWLVELTMSCLCCRLQHSQRRSCKTKWLNGCHTQQKAQRSAARVAALQLKYIQQNMPNLPTTAASTMFTLSASPASALLAGSSLSAGSGPLLAPQRTSLLVTALMAPLPRRGSTTSTGRRPVS